MATNYVDGTIVQTGVNGSGTANAATVDVVVPPGVLAGQKMVVVVAQQSVPSTTGVISPSVAGAWTLRADASGHAGTTNPVDLATFTRTATTADAASTTASPVVHRFAGTNVQGRMIGAVVGYGEVDDSSPILAATFATGSSTANRAATLTFAEPALLVMAVSDRAASGYGPGTSGMVERLDLFDYLAAQATPAAPSNTSLAVFDSGTPVAAGTVTRTVVATNGASPTSSTQATMLLALRQAVPPANVAPSLTVTPATIAAAEPGDTYSVTAAPTDSDGTIASTTFSCPTLTLTGSGLTRSFQIPLSFTEDVHTITVTTTDDDGATQTATCVVTQASCDIGVYDGTQLVPAVDYVMA